MAITFTADEAAILRKVLGANPQLAAAVAFRQQWLSTARPNQITPQGNWRVWFCKAGRGWGKTKTGAEDVAWYGYTHPGARIGIIAPTAADVRDTCYEGVSGLLSFIPPPMLRGGSRDKAYNRSLGELYLANGTFYKGFSSEEPERLRGPNHHRLWAEELAAWKNAGTTWDMAQFGLRLVHERDTPNTETKTIVTSTPKPTSLVRHLVALESTILSVGSTYDNEANLSQKFLDDILKYEGTKIGRQEIHAEILDPEEEGIYQRSWFRLWPSAIALPVFDMVMQSYDTAFTEKTWNDPTACTVWGIFNARTVFTPQQILNLGIRFPWIALLLDAWCDRLQYPELRARVIADFKLTYGAGVAPSGKPLLGPQRGNAYPGRKVDLVLIEEKGSGISLLQDLARANIPAHGYNPGRESKTARAHMTSHFVRNGSVWLPESGNRLGQPRDWSEPFLSQVCAFTGDPQLIRDAANQRSRGLHDDYHDDYVDTMTQTLAYLGDMGWIKSDAPPVEQMPTTAPRKTGNPYAA